MSGRKEEAISLIRDKLNNKSFFSYNDIALVTGYHPKYILRLKKELLDGTISFEHGNKNRKPVNAMSDDEKRVIINMYKRSNASIRQFCRFYSGRSYSCIYNLIKEYENSSK